MIRFIIKLVAFAFALLFTAWITPGISFINLPIAFLCAFIVGFGNFFARPIILFCGLEIKLLSLCVSTLILNSLMLLIIPKIIVGFMITGYLPLFLGIVVLSIISIFINTMDLNYNKE